MSLTGHDRYDATLLPYRQVLFAGCWSDLRRLSEPRETPRTDGKMSRKLTGSRPIGSQRAGPCSAQFVDIDPGESILVRICHPERVPSVCFPSVRGPRLPEIRSRQNGIDWHAASSPPHDHCGDPSEGQQSTGR